MIGNLLKIFITKPKILSKRNDVYSKKINGVWRVLKENNEFVFSFNNEGGYIWGLIETGEYSLENIITNYSNKYNLDLNESRKIINDFIDDCRENKLIRQR